MDSRLLLVIDPKRAATALWTNDAYTTILRTCCCFATYSPIDLTGSTKKWANRAVEMRTPGSGGKAGWPEAWPQQSQ